MRAMRVNQHWIADAEINVFLRVLKPQFSTPSKQQHPLALLLNKPLSFRSLKRIGKDEMQAPMLTADQRPLRLSAIER